MACLALFAQVFALAHLLLVPHTRCAEHGETVHEGHVVETRRVPLADGVALAPAASDGGEDHDHCQAASDRRTWSGEQSTCDVAILAIEAVAFVVVETESAPRAVYRTAPKASPPVA